MASRLIKRILDITTALIGFLITFPIFGVIALIIKRDGGPVFYRGLRIGRYGQPFRIFKFRTMVVNAERLGGLSTADDDPRITVVGRFLRKYKLDEIPQILNVLKGEMSLVGPRPEVKYYVDMFNDEERAILMVQPGITDWASLWNSNEGAILAGVEDPEKVYFEKMRPEKIRLQLAYVRRRSFWVDISILAQTVLVVLGRPFNLAQTGLVAQGKEHLPLGSDRRENQNSLNIN